MAFQAYSIGLDVQELVYQHLVLDPSFLQGRYLWWFTVLLLLLLLLLQSNLNSSNTDGSFTMVNSNSFENPYEIHPIAQENKYLVKFSIL